MLQRFFFLLFPLFLFAQEPDFVFLTCKEDPSTSMVIVWKDGESHLEFKRPDQEKWREIKSKEDTINSKFQIHRVELRGLKPDTEYQFRIKEGNTHYFRTLPNDTSRPIRIIVGGDIFMSQPLYEKMNAQVIKEDPDLVILGGDLAYTEGMRRLFKTKGWRVKRWTQLFKIWSKQMVTADGRLIPFIPVIGNHDVKIRKEKQMPLFFQFLRTLDFPIAYRTIKIGNLLSFILLDSGHSSSIDGTQTKWLKEQLENPTTKYHFPVYHLNAYPSESSSLNPKSMSIRRNWVPLFEENNLKIVFEHDSHTYKRTYPIKKGKIDKDNGVVYLGDGAWGVPAFAPKPQWYLEKTSRVNNYWKMTVTNEGCHFQAVDIDGKVLDQLTLQTLQNDAADSRLQLSLD